MTEVTEIFILKVKGTGKLKIAINQFNEALDTGSFDF
jgi:hypothetical protein